MRWTVASQIDYTVVNNMIVDEMLQKYALFCGQLRHILQVAPNGPFDSALGVATSSTPRLAQYRVAVSSVTGVVVKGQCSDANG